MPIISELINNSHTSMEEPPKHPAVAALFSELLAATNLNAAGLAKKLGITPQAVSNYIVGRNEPGRKMMASIIKAFPAINAVWLATGEGEPFPNGVHNEKAEPAYRAQLRETAERVEKIANKLAAPATPVATEAGLSRAQLVEHADTVLKLAEVEQKLVEAEKQLSGVTAEKDQLSERLKDAKEEILWLRGKSPASLGAADFASLAPLPAPNEIGYHACAKRRAAEFDEYVAVRQEQGGVAELV